MTAPAKQQCEECGSLFARKYTLSRHKQMFHGAGNFTCEQCGKKFANIARLEYHINVHNKVKPYKCQHCNKTFANICRLKPSKHSCIGDATAISYKCDICKKMFPRSDTLLQHKKAIHQSKLPYSCAKCGVCFAFRMQKHRHVKKCF